MHRMPDIVVASFVVCLAILLGFKTPGHAVEVAPQPHAKVDSVLATSAISAVLDANGGKPPATGEQLWQTLNKLGKFAQLPVVFSAVRLDSGLGNPRVIIAPAISRLSDAKANQTNIVGRVFFAANMEKDPTSGDPYVASVEFISWNTARRQFDFGTIEKMGREGSPEFRIVEGGRCFSCHKNRGPILGAAPWTNSNHLEGLRNLTAAKLRIVPILPQAAPIGMRDRIDGMALVAPQAVAVDDAVSAGRQLRIYRETFRLMNRSPAGRKAFVTLLLSIVEAGEFDPNNAETKRLVNTWDDDPAYSFHRFEIDWLTLIKRTNSGVLIDFSPVSKKLLQPRQWEAAKLQPLPQIPSGGIRNSSEAQLYQLKLADVTQKNQAIEERNAENLVRIVKYDIARADGKHDMPSGAMPSNPKAFLSELPTPPRKPSGIVNPFLLAVTIGLTDGDRRFIARSLEEAVERLKKSKVSAKTLARDIFEGSEFADILAGGALPDRDEFKDRFAAGLDKILKTKYMTQEGFNPDRREYTSSPRYDPKAVEEIETIVVPTSACLRCHDVRPAGKARMFESIPALAFDPLDKLTREAWLKSATNERKQEVLSRMLVRLYKDADMPPRDSPEYDRFRIQESAAFDQLKVFLDSELAKFKKP